MSFKWKPPGDKLLLREITESEQHGLLTVVNNTSGLKKGIILSVGKGLPEYEMSVKEGDAVLYKKEHAEDVIVEGEVLKLVQERNAWIPLSELPND